MTNTELIMITIAAALIVLTAVAFLLMTHDKSKPGAGVFLGAFPPSQFDRINDRLTYVGQKSVILADGRCAKPGDVFDLKTGDRINNVERDTDCGDDVDGVSEDKGGRHE